MMKRSVTLVFVLFLCCIIFVVPATAIQNGKIAYDSYRDDNDEIYVMNADGTNQTRLTTNTSLDSRPSWSPDSKKIAFYSNRDGNGEIYVMDADGTNQTRLTTNTEYDVDPAWSSNGTKIAFASVRDDNWEIYVMDADGTNQTRLTTDTEYDGDPTWSPDNSKIAFTSARDGNWEIYVMNSEGTGQTRLTTNTSIDDKPAWSPDGSKIAFTSYREGYDQISEIYVMNTDGTNQTRLTTNQGYAPAWSPDGSKIAFTSYQEGNYDIYIMNANGTNQTRLTTNTSIDNDPSWGKSTVSGSIIVTGPNGGEGYAINHGYGIQWQYTGNPGQTVKIELLKGGILNTVLTPSESIGTDGLGYYYWIVSPTQPIGDDYSLRISSTQDPAVNDTSDGLFSIMPFSGVLLQAPNGGETWQQGTSHQITWTYYSSWGATTAEIYLLKADQVVSTINTTVPVGSNHQGSYDWTVPQSVVPGNDYKIRIYLIPGEIMMIVIQHSLSHQQDHP